MTRTLLGFKISVLLGIYGAACAVLALWLSQVMRSYGELAVLGARYSLALFLIPNVLSFALSAWFLRGRWTNLRVPQMLVVSILSAAVTIVVATGCAFLFSAFVERSQVVSEIAGKTTMVLPGIIAAQLLRIGQNDRAPVPAA
jgi:hypothetical protein